MQILFAITVLCFAGIIWAALVFARHIKATNSHRASKPVIVPKLTPIPVSVRTQIFQPIQHDFRHHFLTAPADVPARNTREIPLNQSVHDIAANKQWTLPPHATRIHRLPLRTVAAAVVNAAPSAPPERKPPQPARYGRLERLDPAYFNKDMGDLSDPHPSNNLRANDRAPINRY
jgi:hypothetical protein